MDLLTQAVRNGFKDAKALREHKDFEPLRGARADFPKLLQELDERRDP
jgi:hypothetical protein